MNFVAIFMAVFSMIGALDLIFGNKLGIGEEFKKGFHLLGSIALSMIGMIVISPLIGEILTPLCNFIYTFFRIDPSFLPAMILANDMGGAPLAVQIAQNNSVGMFNALVVSSMMGCTISFSLPFALTSVAEEKHDKVLLGFLCGIMTIPIGCFVAGLILKINIFTLIYNMIPLILFSIIVVIGLILFPKQSIVIFNIIGSGLQILIIIGLALGILRFLTGMEIIPGLASFEDGAMICFNAAAVMSGAFPFLSIISNLFVKPIKKLGKLIKINTISALGFISTLASNITTFETMESMDDKGIVLNSAFAVSAGFALAGHIAFTLSFNADYVIPVIIGKLVSGISAVLVALYIYNNYRKSK